jgi:restriction system protein
VGIKAVQEAVASKGYYSCDKAMVVTNSYFTNQTKTLASRNKVQLWDRKMLVKNLLEIKNSEGTSKLRSGAE